MLAAFRDYPPPAAADKLATFRTLRRRHGAARVYAPLGTGSENRCRRGGTSGGGCRAEADATGADFLAPAESVPLRFRQRRAA